MCCGEFFWSTSIYRSSKAVVIFFNTDCVHNIKGICGVFWANVLTWVWVKMQITLLRIRRFTNSRPIEHVLCLFICLYHCYTSDECWYDPPFITLLRMSTGKPSFKNTLEERFVYNLESRFLCLKWHNSYMYIRWLSSIIIPIFINVDRYKLLTLCNKGVHNFF